MLLFRLSFWNLLLNVDSSLVDRTRQFVCEWIHAFLPKEESRLNSLVDFLSSLELIETMQYFQPLEAMAIMPSSSVVGFIPA